MLRKIYTAEQKKSSLAGKFLDKTNFYIRIIAQKKIF